jgi:hypothetical protein
MGIAPWGALGGGHFKSDEQRRGQEGRKMGEASEAAIKISKVLEKIGKAKGVQITSVALAYVMQKTPYVFPIVGGRKIEHLKGNIEGLTIQLSAEDIKEIEDANEFDIGFPLNFLGGPGGVKSPNDLWLMKMAGSQQHVAAPQVRCMYPSLRPYTDRIIATWSSEAVNLILNLMTWLGIDYWVVLDRQIQGVT